MARRRQNTGDGGLSLFFVLLVTALGVIAVVLVFLFKLAVTVAFYALPVVTTGVLPTLRGVARSPPALPDPGDFDDAAAPHGVGKLLAQTSRRPRRDGLPTGRRLDARRYADRLAGPNQWDLREGNAGAAVYPRL